MVGSLNLNTVFPRYMMQIRAGINFNDQLRYSIVSPACELKCLQHCTSLTLRELHFDKKLPKCITIAKIFCAKSDLL